MGTVGDGGRHLWDGLGWVQMFARMVGTGANGCGDG